MKARAVVAAASLALAGAGIGGVALISSTPSGAATLSCPNFTDTDVPTPPAGQTGYLFIGTSVSTSTSTITVTYHVGSGADQDVMVAGTQQGSGAFHYIVDLPQGAVVTNATVTGATAQTEVTVSGCLNGAEVPTTTPEAPTTTTKAPTTTTGAPTPGGTVVTPSGPSVAGETASRPSSSPSTLSPSAATAVQGSARFTG